MRTSLRPRSVYDVLAVIGCFAGLATGGAYAAATIGSDDIIDESILSGDIKDGQVRFSDIGADQISSSRIAADAVTGNDILESSLATVPNAGRVDGYNANGLSRVAYVTSSGSITETGRSTLRSVTITAPKAGFVTLMAATMVDHGSPCTSFCAVHLRFRDAGDGSEHGLTSAAMPLNEPFTRESLSAVATVPVTAGSHTFQLIGTWHNAQELTPDFDSESMTALYTPFNANGGTTPLP